MELASFTQAPAGVDAVLRHPNMQEEPVAAGWLVGCDGAHSAVLDAPFVGETLRSDWILTDVHLRNCPIPENEATICWHRDGVFLVFPISPGRYRLLRTCRRPAEMAKPPPLPTRASYGLGRLVTAQETEEGRRWAESKIKALTGGDPITARFMRQDFFTFLPLFKLFIAGNHKPGLRGVDEAMWRRLNMLTFTVTIPPASRDPELAEKLKAEWPGILVATIQRAGTWQRIGLKPPKAVADATDEYFETEDALERWIEECCERTSGITPTESSKLFDSWKRWAESAGEHPGSQKRFSQALMTFSRLSIASGRVTES